MSWPWHGLGPPPALPPPGQGFPLPFGGPSSGLPPRLPFTALPPGHHPPPPPFFHPVAPSPHHPANIWPPAAHGMPWQHHPPHFLRHLAPVIDPPPHAAGKEQATNRRGRPQERSERFAMRSVPEPRGVDAKAPKGKKRDSSARDLALSKEVLGKLGAMLPGESQAEIDRWVAERKRNWPSRANVARRIAEKNKREESGAVAQGGPRKRPRTEGNSLAVLAIEYGSSDGEIAEGERKSGAVEPVLPKGGKGKAEGRKAGNGEGKKRQRGRRNGKKGNKHVVTVSRRPNLLRKLLEKEIQKERNILLQAFRYILSKNRETL